MENRNFRAIRETKARNFWADLMGTIYHDPAHKGTSGIMSTGHIAELMHISEEKAENFLRSCLRYNLTDRSCGCWVV